MDNKKIEKAGLYYCRNSGGRHFLVRVTGVAPFLAMKENNCIDLEGDFILVPDYDVCFGELEVIQELK